MIALGLASASFAFLNRASGAEIAATGLGGGIGQAARAWMLRRHFNHYGVVALTAVAASGSFVLLAVLARYLGLPLSNYPAGFVRSAAVANDGRNEPLHIRHDDLAVRSLRAEHHH